MSNATPSELNSFVQECSYALIDNTLQRLVFSKYRGDDKELKRIAVRSIELKGQRLASCLYEYRTNHITKNIELGDLTKLCQQWLENDFLSAHLITLEWEIQLSISKKGKVLINNIVIKMLQRTRGLISSAQPKLCLITAPKNVLLSSIAHIYENSELLMLMVKSFRQCHVSGNK